MKPLVPALLLAALLFTAPLAAQVKSSSFNLTLMMLLSRDVPEISVTEAAKGSGRYLFLDAREKEEFNVSHLPGARFLGYKDFSLSTLQGVAKNHPLVVYCSIGKRSEDITRKLKEAGFTNVKNLYGGLFEWVNAGHPVYDSQGQPTTRVHAFGKFWGRYLTKGTKVY